LNVIARAKNLGQIDKDSGLTDDALYQVIAPDSSPTFAMVAKFIHALGFKLTIEQITAVLSEKESYN
jgi:probable addiction module antidote protein